MLAVTSNQIFHKVSGTGFVFLFRWKGETENLLLLLSLYKV